MSRPLVSVCVVTYNQRLMIEACLRSILDQRVDADIRVLVGDDASNDGTSEVINRLVGEYGPRLVHFRRESNMGASRNMCDLLVRAQGDFVARVDGDDYWLPGKLSRQLTFLETQPDCNVVYTNAITVDELGRQHGIFNDVGNERITLAGLLRRGNFLNNSSVLFRSVNIPGWAKDIEQIDYQVHLWQAEHGWLAHIGEPLAAYRVNVAGSMVRSSNEHVRELYWQAIQSVPRHLVSDGDYARGITDFLRRVVFRAAGTRDPRILRTWVPRIYKASPYGILRTTGLATTNIIRMAGKMALGRMCGGGHRHVLYRR